MSFGGYAGQILYIDLTSGMAKKEPLKDEYVLDFLGGVGIHYRLAAEIIDPLVDPLSPENAIILGTGTFSGTIVPSSSKLSATTKFPINGAIASARGGGRFPIMLKSSGYDHVVITGAAKYPVYVRIQDDEVVVEDARGLWGKDIVETVSRLTQAHEPCSVVCTGPAGENLVKISMAFIDGTGHLGSGGLAAVMGSKNLKAVVACQGNHPLEVADRLRLEKLVNGLVERMRNWPGRQPLLDGAMTDVSLEGWVREPRIMDNWTRAESRGPQEVRALEELVLQHRKGRQAIACPSCQMPCKERAEVMSGPYAGTVTFGQLILPFPGNGDMYGRSAKYTSELNRYGICRSQFGALLYLVSYLQDLELLSDEQVGFRVQVDDLEGALRLIEMISYRRGFGEVLADGLLGIAQSMPAAAKYVVHLKGRSPQFGSHAFDPRVGGLGTMEFTMMTSPRGGHIATGGSPSFVPGRSPNDFARHADRMGAPVEAVPRVAPETGFNPGRYTRYSEDWTSLFDCLGLCNRHFVQRFYDVKTITELYNAITGREIEPSQMMQAAERSWNLSRLLNVKAGFSRKDDLPPATWFTPLVAGDKEMAIHDYHNTRTLTQEDVEKLIDEYYDERGWDLGTGAPTGEKLKELGLEHYAAYHLPP